MTDTPNQKKMTDEISALLRARNALLWVVTPEEGRVEKACIAAALAYTYEVRTWTCVDGLADHVGKEVGPGRNVTDPAAMLNYIRDTKQRAVYILRDLPPWMRDPSICRAVRSLARSLPSAPRMEARAMIILTPDANVPPELADHAIVVKWPMPDRAEIAEVFNNCLAGLDEAARSDVTPAIREAAIEAAVGLTIEAAAGCYTKSIVTQNRKIVPSVIAAEKRRVINQAKGIEWFEPDPRGLAAVGGLELLKPWLVARQAAFSQRAREFGLPLPKGMLLVGVSGCGKSLTAKAVAAAWGVPLLRADMGGAKSKWVGESESNIRAMFAVAEAVGNCVLWIDEIEKALGGAMNGAADGGVSSDALGTFLSWMQERKGSVFVIATANDVTKLPPELLRKGRFDEMFFVDLPTKVERMEILRVTLTQHKRDPAAIALDAVADACSSFTGSEVAAIVPDALFACFAENERALNTFDLKEAAKRVVPLAKTAAEKITELRNWAKTCARASSLPEVEAAAKSERDLDL